MKTIDELKKEVADTKLPDGTKDLFYKVLDTAEVATLSEEEQMRYESNLKNYMDTMGCIRFAKKEGISEGYNSGHADGKAEGKAERSLEIAKSMKEKGLEASLIAGCTGLSIEEIENL